MANVLHDWDDERAEAILRNCRTAMPPHAKVLVIERAIADDHTKSIPTLVTDINMMVLSGGMERTDNEYAKLFARVGLQLTRVLPVRAPYAIFEGAQNPP
jgi:O-methyltransferase domain